MARSYNVLATGDPETDRKNLIAMHLQIKSLESRNQELEHANDQLTKVLKRLTDQQPTGA